MVSEPDCRSADFRFYAYLKELLPKYHSSGIISQPFRGRQSIKHLIESLYIPHTEIGFLLSNGVPVNESYIVRDGDRLSVFPHFAYLADHSPIRHPKFSADGHLGRLARTLRMLGFDTFYQNDIQDEELEKKTLIEKRILLTRDRGLLMRKSIRDGCLIRSLDSTLQLKQVLHRYHLRDQISPFTRCIRCNGLLKKVQKQAVLHLLEPLTKKYFNEFKQCQKCAAVYWQGSHFEKLQEIIQQVKSWH